MTTNDTLPVWDLSPFYKSPTDPKIKSDMSLLAKEYQAIQKKYKGKVHELSGEQMEALVEIMEALSLKSGKLGAFASLLTTVDTKNEGYGALQQKITEWAADLSKYTLFFGIEWKKVPEEKALRVINAVKNPTYKHFLTHMRAFAPYALSEEIEEVLIEKDVTGWESWERLFTQMTSSFIYLFNRKKLTQSEVMKLLSDPQRVVRKQASEVITETLFERKMELTHIYNTLIADKMLEDKRRTYPSWLTGRNLGNKVSDKVVNKLIESVTGRYDIVSRHYTLKRKLLGLSELMDFDRYAPLNLSKKETNIPWNDAVAIVQSAYRDFSPEMGDVVETLFKENAIHAALLPHKRPGAFSASTIASIHPYILMNYTGKDDDVMTLAHELGHAIHQYLAGKTHGQIGMGMPLTTQELASTFGEMITFSKLKETVEGKEKLALLMKKTDSIIATVFRQTAMHCFEDAVHWKRRKKGELKYDDFCEVWMKTQRAMFGKSVKLREEYRGWWSYIPHFIHTPGYVYSYAFGELLALSLYKLYITNPHEFTPTYVALLKAGNSDYPENLLKKAGVDITTDSIWYEGLSVIDEFVAEETKLATELGLI